MKPMTPVKLSITIRANSIENGDGGSTRPWAWAVLNDRNAIVQKGTAETFQAAKVDAEAAMEIMER